MTIKRTIIAIPDDMLAAITAYPRARDPIQLLAEAIRQLIAAGLDRRRRPAGRDPAREAEPETTPITWYDYAERTPIAST